MKTSNPHEAINHNTKQMSLMGMQYAIAAKAQDKFCRHRTAPDQPACEICRSCSDVLILAAISLGLVADAVQSGKHRELLKVLVEFGKEHSKEFPFEEFMNGKTSSEQAGMWAEYLSDEKG